MKRISAIFLLTTILFLCPSVPGHTEDGAVTPYEQTFLELINEARDDPLSMAASLGMDTDQILVNFPELKDMLIDGLPALSYSQNLYEAATAHTNDMLDNGYYAHDSLDGRTYDERIMESGYEPVVTGEALGMLAFANFIEPDEAVRLIFKNMFMNELDPTKTEQRNILNPDLRDVGIGIGAGEFTMGGFLMNIYMAACDFASTDAHLAEMELIALINQARNKPLATAEAMGMDPDEVLANLPDLHDILQEGIAPVRFNKSLYAATFPLIRQIRDTIQNGNAEPPPGSPWLPEDAGTVDERAIEYNYLPLFTGEIVYILKYQGNIEAREAAAMIFESIYRNELNPYTPAERILLNPTFKDLGVGLDVVTIEREDDVSLTYWIVVGDFGLSVQDEQPSIIGVVYTDLNQDGIYNPGEEIPGVTVSIEGGETSCGLVTDMAGQCAIRREPGSYKAVAYLPDGVREESVDLGDENQALWFRVQKNNP